MNMKYLSIILVLILETIFAVSVNYKKTIDISGYREH